MGGGLEERPEVRGRLKDVREPNEVGKVRREGLDLGSSEVDLVSVGLEMSL